VGEGRNLKKKFPKNLRTPFVLFNVLELSMNMKKGRKVEGGNEL